jgi:arylsulfatase A-like enzyme
MVGALAVAVVHGRPQGGPNTVHNLVLFVPDGLRALAVTADSAPTLAAVRDRGVNFKDPHSLVPTLTTANASAMATGHYFGDTGNFANTLYAGFRVRSVVDSVTPFLEHDVALGDLDEHFDGDYLGEETLLTAARAAGVRTALVGKLGPTLIFDHTARRGDSTIVVDDSTGRAGGIPMSDAIRQALVAAGLPLQAPTRGENGEGGTSTKPGTHSANVEQQNYFVDVATKVILPAFAKDTRPFLLVFWSRDPDGSQHNQGDSLNQLTPGINGPTSRAGLKNADDNLSRIQSALAANGLTPTTNIVVAADHGFSTISKQSETSRAARDTYSEVPHSLLPPGFLAIDLAIALDLPLFDPDDQNMSIGRGHFPRRANGLIGRDPTRPDVVVAANGGSDLVYVPSGDKALTARIVEVLGKQDYVSGIFADDRVGDQRGTLPLSAIYLDGSAKTQRPTLVVTFRSFATGCPTPFLCAVDVADTTRQQGQGDHGSFSRADTMNFMAAIGPDFKAGFVDSLPVSNADVGRTIGSLLGLRPRHRGTHLGRVLTEAFPTGSTPTADRRVLRARASAGGVRTELRYQTIGPARYFDVAGTRGRTVGLD